MRALGATLAAIALLSSGAAGGPASSRIAVVASFYPLYEFARRVGGDRVAARTLTPAGAEPHDYELTPRDIIAVNRARVLIYNGAGFEPWVQTLLPQIAARVVTVNASEGVQLARTGSGGARGQIDPHVWLDPVLAQRQVANILAGLARADPAGQAVYEANAAAFEARLGALHERIQRTLAPCRKKVFVTSHAAFGYFAARYGLTQVAIGGLAPQAEPSAAKIRDILKIVRQHDIRVIYYETLVSPRVAAAIAREVGARTAVLNPIEGLTDAEQRRGADYLAVMDQNLRSLAQGLDCP
jgi:zinc transport system substrate-binding protein